MLATLIGLNTNELRTLVEEEGESRYRGKQLAEWIYQRGARTFDDMINLPLMLRARLEKKYEIQRSQIVTVQHSRDGTIKLLLAMHDGSNVETVGLPYLDRFSCCLSTQVGCPIGCIFCATGLSGYIRNLTAGEVADQVLAVQEAVRNQPFEIDSRSCRIDHVTFMGMGEPLLNYEASVKAMQLLNSELGISMRHLTVSTVGFVPGIRKLMWEKLQITLAVSLHAPTDDLRRQLIPKMIKWSVAEIIDACREYMRQTGRRVTFEYCLFDRVNDGIAEAHELAKVLHGLNCHVNLIPYNPVCGLAFRTPSPKHIRAFREILDDAGIQITQRIQRGSDIDAACGQLRQRTIGEALDRPLG
ncbi:MAG: 23S rRNA (adenine(2503)-C(2))-methyltransferase RlmN [Chloroflexi bacterium]|nr:23S rRNA (adenine(2503)-C(2))-methyltransferase RlmN [Chloroflexota bacterium]